MLKLGTMTKWGKIAAIGMVEGERYYWMVGKGGISMIPAATAEA